MGVWAYPDSEEKVTSLEIKMSSPIPARRADADLYHLVGDDTFFDMTSGVPSSADVRPLVAITLDEWVNWSAPGSFQSGTVSFDRLRDLIEPYRHAPISDLSTEPVSDGSPEAAMSGLWAIVGEPAESPVDASRFDVAPGYAPATHALRDRETGKVYRYEHVYGVVVEAAPGSFAADGAIFDHVSPPRLS